MDEGARGGIINEDRNNGLEMKVIGQLKKSEGNVERSGDIRLCGMERGMW